MKGHIPHLAKVFLLLLGLGAYAQEDESSNQPYSSYWFINELLEWDKEKDPHAPFNVSYTPLAERFVDSSTQIRPELSTDPSIVALIASHATSNLPSQGFDNIKQYALPYWQYLDYMVHWGGSSGEGLVIAPSKPWIDAAHKNGVKILGTVFFPPNVYGGKEEWVREFLQKTESGAFPVADKLIEVAEYYGFDGWFINQETHGLGVKEADLMQELLIYYQEKSNLRMMWYDAMIEDGRVIWQDEFNDHNATYFQQKEKKLSDIMFIDFGWSVTDLEDSRKKAEAMGRSSWELYAGIDVQSNGYKSFANWDALYDENDQPYTTSVGIYWLSSTFGKTKNKQPEEVYANEQLFWNGGVKFKTRWGREAEWKGFSNYFPARSVISEVPFVTNFNYGLGRFYNDKGKRISDDEWHNLSLQDILPTWQWVADTAVVKPSIYFNDSYTGGSCLKFDIDGEAVVPLYKTNLPISKRIILQSISKQEGDIEAQIIARFDDNSVVTFDLKKEADWAKTVKPLENKSSARLVKISLGLKGAGSLQLGELAVRPKTEVAPKKPRAKARRLGDSMEVVVEVESDAASSFYDFYYLTKSGSKKWLKRNSGTIFYLDKIPQTSDRLLIWPMAESGRKGRSSTIKIEQAQ